MARRLFFVNEIHHQRAEISGEEARHLSKVLRVEPGQTYEISDNQSLFLAEVEAAHRERVSFRILEQLEPRRAPVRITLLAGIIKFDRFEWILEKATELGVETIIPVETARIEKGLEKAAVARLERWRKIVLESAQQSRRAHLPEVGSPQRFHEALKQEASCRLFLDEDEGGHPLLTVLPRERCPTDHVVLLTGPEGGWTAPERLQARNASWTPATLGPQILRAETAAIAAISIVSAAWHGS